ESRSEGSLVTDFRTAGLVVRVLRRRLADLLYDPWPQLRHVGSADLHDVDDMLPVVAEIEPIAEGVALRQPEAVDRCRAGILDATARYFGRAVLLVGRIVEAVAADEKLPQMLVRAVMWVNGGADDRSA
ncbi:MAG: hypothetical protein WCJ30_13515, partial [Deltaproteobacteria bacterium]